MVIRPDEHPPDPIRYWWIWTMLSGRILDVERIWTINGVDMDENLSSMDIIHLPEINYIYN